VSATSYSDDSTFLSMMAVGETLAGRSNGSGFPGTLSEGKYLIATHSPHGRRSRYDAETKQPGIPSKAERTWADRT
jgi:hypothetical protein